MTYDIPTVGTTVRILSDKFNIDIAADVYQQFTELYLKKHHIPFRDGLLSPRHKQHTEDVFYRYCRLETFVMQKGIEASRAHDDHEDMFNYR
jgi:hypothetical protein